MWVNRLRKLPQARPSLAVPLTFLSVLLLTVSAIGENPPARRPNSFQLEPGLTLPLDLMSPLPKMMAIPRVAPPRKKLDPKYDVSKIGGRQIGKGLDFYSQR